MQPAPVFLPGESQGWGAWWAAIYGVAQGQTRLKRLSSSSSSPFINSYSAVSFGFSVLLGGDELKFLLLCHLVSHFLPKG